METKKWAAAEHHFKIKRKGQIEYENRDYSETPYHFDLFQNWSSEKKVFFTNSHPEIEIIYTIEGPEPICINNDTYIAEPGDLTIVNSGHIHTGVGDRWVHHALIPASDFLAHLNINLLSYSFTPHIRDEKLSKLFLEIIEEVNSTEAFHEEAARVAAERFLLTLLRGYGTNRMETLSKNTNDAEFRIASKVLNFLNCHFDKDFAIEEIANQIGISSPHMCRCVKNVTGISIIDHLNIIRCRAAYHYLINTDKSINEIASLCGFNGRSYFAKVYKNVMGTLPSEVVRKAAAKKRESEKGNKD